MKRLGLLACLMLVNGILFSQTGIVDDAEIKLRIFNANQAYYGGDINKALKIYTEVSKAKPNDGSVLYHIGQCYYALQEMDDAIKYLQKAENIDTDANQDMHLTLGLAYQQDDQLDEATTEFTWHKKRYSSNPKKIKGDAIDHLIAECALAKQMENNPVNVKVRNAGDAINSEYNEKTPSVTADGATLIFTSDRPLLFRHNPAATAVSPKEVSQDFDNVYMCKWDSAKNTWGLSFPIDGDVNMPLTHTCCTSISPDGNYIFLFKNSTLNSSLGGDIYISKKSTKDKWTKPMSVGKPVNTSYYEDGACLSPDGNTIYFVSERPGGFGKADIYKADKINSAVWGNPENLGHTVNSELDEGAPFMAADGRTLFFSSEGHASMGGYDIFKSAVNDSSGKWSTPVNLGYPINTVNNEKFFTISADGRTAYFASDRKGGIGKRDIYIADLSNYSVLETNHTNSKPIGFSVLRGRIKTKKGAGLSAAEVIVSDSLGTKMATLNSSSGGMYFITLKAKVKYKIKVSAKGYKSASKPIWLPDSPLGTYTMQQDITLEKE